MPAYFSPGVYVEEIPSADKPIAGVSTSTACFLGIVPDKIQIPVKNEGYDPTGKSKEENADKPSLPVDFLFPSKKNLEDIEQAVKDAKAALAANKDATKAKDLEQAVSKAEATQAEAPLRAGDMEPILCTNFTQFTKHFGGFSTDGLGVSSADISKLPAGTGLQNRLAHAVFGFFDNGGTRCYVMRFATAVDLKEPSNLDRLEAIEEISLVAAPGIVDKGVQENIVGHCEKLKNRFAILDPPELGADGSVTEETIKVVGNTNYGALYFPRIQVFDFAAQITQLEKPPDVTKGEIWMGPSGHIAGIYSRVDHERGVHKAPANEVVRGAMELEYRISRNDQDGLNPYGVNCIRHINDNITVWGARTIGGDANSDLKYVNVRRTLIFLRESIYRGTQSTVFEPNDQNLWAKIVRNITAFLTTVWRDGALFGSTVKEAFYVKCDAELNPPAERDLGRVTTEIGVAIVRPAEFVIFRISQWSAPQGSQ